MAIGRAGNGQKVQTMLTTLATHNVTPVAAEATLELASEVEGRADDFSFGVLFKMEPGVAQREVLTETRPEITPLIEGDVASKPATISQSAPKMQFIGNVLPEISVGNQVIAAVPEGGGDNSTPSASLRPPEASPPGDVEESGPATSKRDQSALKAERIVSSAAAVSKPIVGPRQVAINTPGIDSSVLKTQSDSKTQQLVEESTHVLPRTGAVAVEQAVIFDRKLPQHDETIRDDLRVSPTGQGEAPFSSKEPLSVDDNGGPKGVKNLGRDLAQGEFEVARPPTPPQSAGPTSVQYSEGKPNRIDLTLEAARPFFQNGEHSKSEIANSPNGINERLGANIRAINRTEPISLTIGKPSVPVEAEAVQVSISTKAHGLSTLELKQTATPNSNMLVIPFQDPTPSMLVTARSTQEPFTWHEFGPIEGTTRREPRVASQPNMTQSAANSAVHGPNLPIDAPQMGAGAIDRVNSGLLTPEGGVVHFDAELKLHGASVSGGPTNTRSEVARPIIAQLTDAVRGASSGAIEVKLAPEELGRVKLSLSPTEAGLTVTILAERPETMDLIRRNVDIFAQDLRQQGHQNLTFQFGQNGGQGGQDSNTRENAQFESVERNETSSSALNSCEKQTAEYGRLDLRL